MAKVRAYKLAEELGIERSEFVERAAAEGVELKSPMAALEAEQVDLLREKLGSQVVQKSAMDEMRVQSKSGSTIVRRRRKKVEEPPVVEAPPTLEPVVAEQEPVVSEEVESLETPVEEQAPEPVVQADAATAPTPAPAAAGAAAPGTPAPARKRPGAEEPPDRTGKQRKRVREVVNLREQEQVKLQYAGRGGPRRRVPIVSPRSAVNPRTKRRDKLNKPAVAKPAAEQARSIRVAGEISVGELAKLLGAKAPAIQGKLMALGTMVSVNQTVDIETCRKVAEEMGFEVQDTGFKEEEFFDAPAVAGEAEEPANLEYRPPVITVMGHVDHGKTSILDAIRKTSVVDGEAGGITQHIGAYRTEVGDSTLTFIDTPGHASFTQMRARGAALTDMVVLVVAATEGVMPQTVEAIQHSRAADCPIVVAVNKMDLPGADSPQIRQRLMEHELIAEDFGGETIFVDVSAKTGEGLDQLLEMLSLQAEVLELKADPSLRAGGVVIEASLSKGRGPVATVLVQEGTLQAGDVVVCETEWGRVRTMQDDKGERLKAAGPSVPVQLVGLSGVPSAGARFHVVESERVAKRIIDHREDQERGKPMAPAPKLTLEEFFAQSGADEHKELPVILKADVQGTCEAVRDSLHKMSTDAVTLKVISTGVGGITENDITFASASNAIVLGFHSRPDPAARTAAEAEGVEIRTYTIIYELLDDVKAAMAGLLPPTISEVMLGRAEVRQPFTIPKIGTIGGSYVTEGAILRNARCRLIRDGIQVYEGKVGSLRRFKDDAREVKSGFECGIGIEGYNDVKQGDVIEAFDLKEEPGIL
ncbi:MAG: translation initiation factor IF-2 [Myxococcota bacterium]|nr:translation initiation factor IF-2 [Myxococcota bacterium]